MSLSLLIMMRGNAISSVTEHHPMHSRREPNKPSNLASYETQLLVQGLSASYVIDDLFTSHTWRVPLGFLNRGVRLPVHGQILLEKERSRTGLGSCGFARASSSSCRPICCQAQALLCRQKDPEATEASDICGHALVTISRHRGTKAIGS